MIPNMPHGSTGKSGSCSRCYKTHTKPSTTMANAGRNGPLLHQMRPQAPQQCIVRMGSNPQASDYNFVGSEGVYGHQSASCSGDDASPQHRSVLRAIHPLIPPKIITACLGDLPPSSNDNGAGHKASCGAQGGHFRLAMVGCG